LTATIVSARADLHCTHISCDDVRFARFAVAAATIIVYAYLFIPLDLERFVGLSVMQLQCIVNATMDTLSFAIAPQH
jgi:hypothetical protein